MTRKEVLERVLGMEEVKADTEVTEVLEKMLEQVTRKRTSETAAQKANKELTEKIYEVIAKAEAPVAVSALVDEFNLTNQKIASLVRPLVEAERVKKVKQGKLITYVLAD